MNRIANSADATISHYIKSASEDRALRKCPVDIFSKVPGSVAGRVAMGIYKEHRGTDDTLQLVEHAIYGSSRLGLNTTIVDLSDGAEDNDPVVALDYGTRQYELSDHLGNVSVVLSGIRLPNTGNTNFTADVLSANEYYPFGMVMPNRNFSSENYRYGFNGMEKDQEFTGSQSHYDFGARIYDGRIGRWLSIDPYYDRYRSHSPYNYAVNSPIFVIDSDGNNPTFPWGVRYEFPNGQGDAEVVKFNDEKASYYVSWWDKFDSGDERYWPKTLVLKDEEIYERAKKIDTPNSMESEPSWNIDNQWGDAFGVEAKEAMAKFQGGHRWGNPSFYWSPYRGWTGGWAGAASSNEYVFIDDVYNDGEFNRVFVNDGVIHKMEGFKYDAEKGEYVLKSTTTFTKTDRIKVDQWVETNTVLTWTGLEEEKTSHLVFRIVYEKTVEYSDGRVEKYEVWEEHSGNDGSETEIKTKKINADD